MIQSLMVSALHVIVFVYCSIVVGIVVMSMKRKQETRKMTSHEQQFSTPSRTQLEKDVVNPLALEADLEGDNDENTRTLQDLIHESQMK